MTKTIANAVTAGERYIFTKSYNEVKAISPAEPYMGQPCWIVERTKGVSAGKQMVVPARALVPVSDYET